MGRRAIDRQDDGGVSAGRIHVADERCQWLRRHVQTEHFTYDAIEVGVTFVKFGYLDWMGVNIDHRAPFCCTRSVGTDPTSGLRLAADERASAREGNRLRDLEQ